MTTKAGTAGTWSKAADGIEFYAIYTISFVPCLAAAALRRLVPGGHRRGGRSIFGEARAAARECVSFAFMA